MVNLLPGDGDDASDLKAAVLKHVNTWLEAVGSSTSLIGGNAKIRDERDPQTLLQKDPNHTLLKAVVASRVKITKASNQIAESLQDPTIQKWMDRAWPKLFFFDGTCQLLIPPNI